MQAADAAAGSARDGARERFVVTEAERQVADLLAIEVDPSSPSTHLLSRVPPGTARPVGGRRARHCSVVDQRSGLPTRDARQASGVARSAGERGR